MLKQNSCALIAHTILNVVREFVYGVSVTADNCLSKFCHLSLWYFFCVCLTYHNIEIRSKFLSMCVHL